MTARVLIVEDHALVAIGLQLALSARGWEVETTDGPTAAAVIDHARRFEPQVVLCDINLGEGIGSGIDLVAPLRASGAEVVVLTAETRPESSLRVWERGLPAGSANTPCWTRSSPPSTMCSLARH